MLQFAKLFEDYTPVRRIIIHIIFWSCLFGMYIMVYSRYGENYGWLFAIKDLIAITVIFYSTAYIILPMWLMNRRYVLSSLWLLVIYLWWSLLTYLFCLALNRFGVSSDDPAWPVIDAVLRMGVFASIVPPYISFYLLDFIYLVSLPLGIKLTQVVLNIRNQKTVLELKNAELTLRNNVLALNNVELELAFLKSQINPHFLFNALNNITFLMKKDIQKAIEIQQYLTGILGYLVYETNKQTIPLDEEYVFLKNYIELERIRLHSETIVEVSITSDREDYKIVPLIVFPLLENAFKHGPMASGKNAALKIFISAYREKLVVNISNGYILLDKPKGYKGGIGLDNVVRRLELYYADEHELNIDDNGKWYSVNLIINLSGNKEQVVC